MPIFPVTRGGESLRRRIASSTTGPFVHDTFTDSDGTLLENHTGEVGASWVQHPSFAKEAYIQSNSVVPVDELTHIFYYALGAPPSADYTVTGSILLNVLNNFVGPCGRMNTAVDTLYYVRYNGGADQLELFKRVAGTETGLGTSSSLGWALFSTHTIALILAGTSIVVEADGSSIMSTTDSDISTAGKAGIFFYGQSNRLFTMPLLELTAE